MVTILGTGHVFDLRDRVQAEIYNRLPTAVALELDPARYQALQRPKEERGKGPFFYQLLANFQNRVAEAYGVEAGDEMLAASEAAKRLSVPVALIDRDAQVTFRRLLTEMPFGEKARLLGSAVGSAFVRTKSIDQQVKEMEQDYSGYFAVLGTKFPTLKRVLLDERNRHMSEAIRELAQSHPNLVVVMGDGHVDGVVQILSGWDVPVETVRLKELRVPGPAAVPPPASPEGESTTANVRVTFEVPDEPAPDYRRGDV